MNELVLFENKIPRDKRTLEIVTVKYKKTTILHVIKVVSFKKILNPLVSKSNHPNPFLLVEDMTYMPIPSSSDSKFIVSSTSPSE